MAFIAANMHILYECTYWYINIQRSVHIYAFIGSYLSCRVGELAATLCSEPQNINHGTAPQCRIVAKGL